MKLSGKDYAELGRIVDNIFKFSSEQTGMGSGLTSGYEEVLTKLRYSAALFYKAANRGDLKWEHIDTLEADVKMAVTASRAGLLSSFKSAHIDMDEIEEIIKFLDRLRLQIGDKR